MTATASPADARLAATLRLVAERLAAERRPPPTSPTIDAAVLLLRLARRRRSAAVGTALAALERALAALPGAPIEWVAASAPDPVHVARSLAARPFERDPRAEKAATRALLLLTDFGAAPLPPPLDREEVFRALAGGIARHLIGGNLGLLLAYLSCADAIGMGSQPAALIGAHVFDRLWREGAVLPADDTPDPPAIDLALAAGVYLAIGARMARTTPLISVGLPEDVGHIETLRARLLAIRGTRVTTESPWLAALDDAPVSDAALASLLWDAAAIEAVRCRDDDAIAALAAMPCKPASATAAALDMLVGSPALSGRARRPRRAS